MDQASTLCAVAKSVDHASPTRVLAITSGKGGVGKTNIVANLAFALTKLGKKVLVVDADLGLANLDIPLDVTPQYTLEHVFLGSESLQDIVLEGPGGMSILPSSSGVQRLTELSADQKLADVVLIDTAAGISSNVIYFVLASQEIIVVTCSEPTAIMDAYALIKILAREYDRRQFLILVNSATTAQEGEAAFEKLNCATQKFLDISLHFLGWIPNDPYVRKAVKQQKLVVDAYPHAQASRAFLKLAMAICALPSALLPSGQIQFFWRRLFHCGNHATDHRRADRGVA
ncbi:MAG: MinD/ParA family protein [Nitrospinae bacterium]|nr:MinD/ParA family protein [Nitrospinota bacterium]